MIRELMYAYAVKISDLKIEFSNVDGDESKAVGLGLSWLTWSVGVLAFFYLVYAGIMYITAGGNADQAKKASQGILYAVIGIVVAVLAYTIIAVIANQVKTDIEAPASILRSCAQFA